MSPSPHYHLSLNKTALFALLRIHERRYLSLFVNINTKERGEGREGEKINLILQNYQII